MVVVFSTFSSAIISLGIGSLFKAKNYTEKDVFLAFDDQERKLMAELVDNNQKRIDLDAAFCKNPHDFLTTQLGQSDEVLYAHVQYQLKKDRDYLLKLVNPESEEYKLAKSKLHHRTIKV